LHEILEQRIANLKGQSFSYYKITLFFVFKAALAHISPNVSTNGRASSSRRQL